MIDGQIDLIGDKEEAIRMFEEFLRGFRKERSLRGLLFRYYIGVYLVPKNPQRRDASERMLDVVEKLEEEIEPSLPVEPLEREKRHGYA